MKEQLELQHVASYLPYEVKAIDLVSDDVFYIDLDNISGVMNDAEHLNTIRLILRPLSDLTKEITHNGETFVPIVELFNLKTQVTPSEIYDYLIVDDTAILRLKGQSLYEFDFRCFFEIDLEPNNVMFSIATETYKDDVLTEEIVNFCGNEMIMFLKLYEWHFDVFGLIEKKLAVDINTLKQ